MNDPAKHNRPKISGDPAELRRRAETRLSEKQTKASQARAHADNERQVHELEVHQIELEMQNEELQEAREAMEALLEKYTDLYDFAPVGYLTLDQKGVICEANLAGASLLGAARSALVNGDSGISFPQADFPLSTLFSRRYLPAKSGKAAT